MLLSRIRNVLLDLSVPLALLASLALATPAAAQTPPQLGETPDGTPFYQWEPSQSWPGGSQHDPRLDRPVSLWGAGILLRDLFASVKDQTGVEIGFFPPGDDNERICVNLYLNSDSPPTLRELMAQLSWVTDCAFAYAEPGEQEPTYYLLSTSIGSGAMKRIRDERDAAIAALKSGEDPDMQIAAQVRDDMLARVPDLADALGLTREQAIKRYKGKDDCLLLVALDPRRQAAAEFVLSLSPEQLDQIRDEITIFPRLSDLSPDQRPFLKQALDANLDRWREYARSQPEWAQRDWGDWAWVEQTDPAVLIGTADPTSFDLILLDSPTMPDGRPALSPVSLRSGVPLGRFQLLVDPRWAPSMRPDSQVNLRRLLGQEVSDVEAQRIYEEHERQRQQVREQRRLEATLASCGHLSGEARALLASISLPIHPDESYSLWQLQEAVAVASGLHVVSDCFLQATRSIERDLDALYPNSSPEMTALLVLRLTCVNRADPRYGSHGLPRMGQKGWEWGDAGGFLRFRSEERDVWRASFLPAHVQAELDSWIEPYLPESVDSQTAPAGIRVPVDPKNCIWLLQQTTGPQRAWGGRLIYGDPTDLSNACRHTFRGKLLEALQQLPHIYRLLGNLTEDQWQRLHAEGLTYDPGFSPPVTDEDGNHGFWLDRQKGDVLRVMELDEDLLDAAREYYGGAIDVRGLFIYRDGQLIGGEPLPLSLYLKPMTAAPLCR
ncbi:MAG: hypothetical protein JSV79_12915 [Armatimonadota bacterium]|nr:MAG: hypothetical protein JSV79_12915 [Armatimonadota bacterium]